MLENEGNEKSHFFISVSKNATEGIFRGYHKPDRWKQDIARSVDMYNNWFMQFAPEAYRTTRLQTTKNVEATLKATGYLTDTGPDLLKAKPFVLPVLRMCTCPPLAVDRLIGLAKVSGNLIKSMEKHGRMPPQMPRQNR